MTSSTTQQYQTTTPVPGRMPEIDPHQRKLDAAKDSWTLLTKQIPQWSKENFGDQKGINHIAPLLGIGEEIGELIFAVDQLNAYYLSDAKDDEHQKENMEARRHEVEDALADIMIYFIDTLGRLGIIVHPAFVSMSVRNDIQTILWDAITDHCEVSSALHPGGISIPIRMGNSILRSLSRSYGELCHVLLKRHQGIRGYEVDSYFYEEIGKAISGFFQVLCLFSAAINVDLVSLTHEVWDSIVSKRNWKPTPQ